MKKALSLVLCLLMIFTSIPVISFSSLAITQSDIPEDIILTSSTQYNVSPGITEDRIITVDKNGENQNKSIVATIDFSSGKVGAMAGYKNYDSSGNWGMQTVRDQAKAAEAATGRNIVLAINADYYNMSTGEPLDVLVMNGKVVKDTYMEGSMYFAILKDGTPVIRHCGESLDDVQEAISGPFALVENGVAREDLRWDPNQMPRNAIGMTADNKVITVLNDGRQSPNSVGYTLYELACLMRDLGCVTALYLDGGGSATYASKIEGETSLTVKNSPSDGTERKVSDSLFFYSTANPTGEFDHAVITPKNEVYTPDSSVDFVTSYVDITGATVDKPEGITYALEDESFGEISEEGKFVSNGKEGIVKVNLVKGEDIVGSTQIEIAQPDTIIFNEEEVTLALNDASDLGVVLKNNNRIINFKDGDIKWEIIPEEGTTGELGAFDACESGSMQANCFRTSATVSGTAVVKATSFFDETVSGTTNVVIGKEPTIVMDFENKTDSDGVTTSAKDYWTIGRAAVEAGGGTISAYYDASGELKWYKDMGTALEPSTTLVTAHYYNSIVGNVVNSRGGEESAEIVTFAENEELVRKGNSSLKINYDFSNINGIEGACVGFASPDITIPGKPTGIGMWVYVPEETANLWLRIRFKDKSGTVLTYNYTDEGQKNVDFASLVGHNADEKITYVNTKNGLVVDGKSYAAGETVTTTIRQALGGLNWTGWKYVECDISNAQGPLTLIGGETVRFMHTNTAYGGMGNYNIVDGKLNRLPDSERKGYVVIDDVQFVYGANNEDTDNPSVDKISVNGVEIGSNTTIRNNEANFTASFSDVQNKNTSGLNYDTVSAWVDGVAVPQENIAKDSSKDEAYIYDYYLPNGDHTVKFAIKDKNDNKAVVTKSFTVNGTDTTYPSVYVKSATDTAYLGKDVVVEIRTTEAEKTDSITAKVKLGSNFKNPEVVAADGYEIVNQNYDAEANTIEFAAAKTGEPTGDGVIAKVIQTIPFDLGKGVGFTFSLPNAAYVSGEKVLTLSASTQTVAVKAKYTLEVATTIAGNSATITVKDEDGTPASDIAVYAGEYGELPDRTDENGTLTTTQIFADKVTDYYAKSEDENYSYKVSAQSYNAGANEDGTPAYISISASKDSENSKNINWQTNPSKAAAKAVVKLATKKDYDEIGDAAFKETEGKSELVVFDGSAIVSENMIVYANNVVVDGLKADTEYKYIVGDGENWSDVQSFRTVKKGTDTSFFIIGDTQAENTDVISQIANTISTGDYAFGVQTGDFVEKTTLYSDWAKILSAFDKASFSSTDVIHVTGNHELFGDVDGSIQNSLFNIDSRFNYSSTYGNVYVAVLGYSDNVSDLEATAKWLKEDAEKSDAMWKIVVSHQPVYGTNEAATDCDLFRKYISEACDEAGIDFMFSGHDHAYARTNPVYEGEKNDNGTVYYVCGSTGEKSYTVSNSRGFSFANEPTNEYTGLYLTVNATASEFTVNTYEADGSLFDTYTKTKEICKNSLHTFSYTSDGYLECSVCGHAEKVGDYTGLVTDKDSGVYMYLANGTPRTNVWGTNGEDNYYLGADGKAVTGTHKLLSRDGQVESEYTFDEKGVNVSGSFVKETVTNPETGVSKEITRYYFGGEYVRRWNEIDGYLYFFHRTNAVAYNEGEMYTGARNVNTSSTKRKYTFAEDGKLLKGAFDDIVDDSGNYIGTRYFWGENYVTEAVTVDGISYNVNAEGFIVADTDIGDCTATLSATSYTYNGSEKKPTVTVKLGDATLTKGVDYTVAYKDNKAVGTATVEITGHAKFTGTKKLTYSINPIAPTGLKATSSSTGKVDLSWSAVAGATSYDIYRSDDGITYKKTGNTTTASYTDSSLVVGKNYKYYVKTSETVSGKTYVSAASSAVSIKPILSGATIVSAKGSAYNTVKVSWSATSGATGYYVYRATSKTGTYSKLAAVSGTSYSDTSAKLGITYYYKIVPYVTNAAGTTKGAESKVLSASPIFGSISDLKASVAYNKVSLSWKAVSGVTGYYVYRATSKIGTYSKVATVSGASYSDTNVKLGATYYYKIVPYVTNASVTTKGTESKVISASPALGGVSGLKASGAYNKVSLSWKAVSGATGYYVYRATSKTGAYSKIATVTINSYADTKVTINKTYYYKVKAIRTVSSKTYTGATSSVVSAKTALKATTITSATDSGKSVTLKWTKVSGANGYVVYRASSKTGTLTKIKTVSGSSTVTWRNTNLKSGTYYYVVKAYRTVGSTTVYSAASTRVAVIVK